MSDRAVKLSIYAAATAGIALALLLTLRGISIADIKRAMHMTARLAFGYFLLVYFARPLRDLIGFRPLLTYRRALGLCVSIALTVHFVLVGAFFALSEQSIFDDKLRLATGGVGVIALYAMTITSNNASVRRLGRGWKRLHSAGVHYLWFFFAASYLIALQKSQAAGADGAAMFAAFLGVMVLGLALRLFLLFRRRAGRARAATSNA